MGRTEEALQEFYWAIDHSPVPSAQHYSNASQALMILGRFDEAKKLLDQWQQQGSLTPFQIIVRYRIAFIENDTATMERLAREIQGGDADPGSDCKCSWHSFAATWANFALSVKPW